jgi:hypothetical protein
MGQPNAMSTVQQNKKKTSNYAKTLAEIKNSISQFERTDLVRCQMLQNCFFFGTDPAAKYDRQFAHVKFFGHLKVRPIGKILYSLRLQNLLQILE